MKLVTKLVTGATLSLAAIAGWTYVSNLKRSAAELQIIPKASLYKLGWDGLVIRVDVLLKNPAKGSFVMQFPFVTVLYKNTVVGSSQASSKEVKVPATSEIKLDPVYIQIPVSNVFSVVFSLVKSLFNKEAITMLIRTQTQIKLGLISIPYENKTEVNLQKTSA
ncbi:MAG: hypothetical protein QM725_01465 [Lacibacter sp.]